MEGKAKFQLQKSDKRNSFKRPDRTCGGPCNPGVQVSRACGHLLVASWIEMPEGKQNLHLAYDLAARHSVHFDVYTEFLVWSNANRYPFVLMCC